MSYYFSTTVKLGFDEAIQRVTEELGKEGFGVLTDIDVRETFRVKLDKDFRPYRILGACNPPAAFRALEAEPFIGTMLPCNVVVQEREPGSVEITAVDPVASMMAIENPALGDVANEIRAKLKTVIERL